jgi:hypothetical protein
VLCFPSPFTSTSEMHWFVVTVLCIQVNGVFSSLLDTLVSSIIASVAPAVNPAITLANLNQNGAIDPRERPALVGKSVFFAQMQTIEALEATDFVFWVGVQFVDGYGYYIYPTNNSWVMASPRSYGGQLTQGYSWEEVRWSSDSLSVCLFDFF